MFSSWTSPSLRLPGPATAACPVRRNPTLKRLIPFRAAPQPQNGADVAGEPPPPPLDVASVLRDARERRGVTVAEAAEKTRIHKQFLEALESDGGIDRFPAPLYARFFLREYARYLGLEEEPLVQAFSTRHGNGQLIQLVAPPAPRPPRRWPAWLLLGLCASGLAAIAVLHFISPRPVRTGAQVGVVSSNPTPNQEPSDRPPQQKPPPINGIQGSLSISSRCWVQATIDGKLSFAETLETGQSRTLRADKSLELKLGNAGGARLRINGKQIQTGGPGEVVTLSFVLQDGKVVRRPTGPTSV